MKIIITGTFGIGTLTRLLARNDNEVTIINDVEQERMDKIASEYDILTMNASPTDREALKEAGVPNADLFIAVTLDQNQNFTACAIAKKLGAKKTVAKVVDSKYADPQMQSTFEQMGVDSVIFPEALAAKDIVSGLKMSWVRQRWDVHDGALVLLGIKLRETCKILDKPLKEISGPNDPYHVVAIKRGTETIIPGGNDELKLYDLAYFMTTKSYIPTIRELVGKEGYADVKNVMIMGGGSTAARAIREIPKYMDVKLFEKDERRCEELSEKFSKDNVIIIKGDGRDVPLLREENIGNTQAFVALTNNDETNILACIMAKRLGVRKTVAMVENIDYISMAESLDIGTIINKKAITGSYIYQMLLNANVLNVRFLMTANADIAEFIAQEGSKITKKAVKELKLPLGMNIGGLVRKGQGMLVSGNTQIEAGDEVMVFCHNGDMKKIEKLFM